MKTSRRSFLGGAAIASLPVSAGASVAASAIQTDAAQATAIAENPDLLAAHARLLDAQAELRAAEDALEWIADEWRHLWPLAPEELLGGSNAHIGGGVWGDTAERNIIGQYLYRDTSGLTQRFDKRQREKTPRTCFSVTPPDELKETITRWENRSPRGRTPKAVERQRKERAEMLARYRAKLVLAEEYEAHTNALRQKAGVDQARRRVVLAKDGLNTACSEISKIPAVGMTGLFIKANAMDAFGYLEVFKGSDGIMGEMARFVHQVISIRPSI